MQSYNNSVSFYNSLTNSTHNLLQSSNLRNQLPLELPGFLLLLFLLFPVGYFATRSRGPPLPPGPKPYPIIGNLPQLVKKPLPEQLTEWHKLHGPIISFWSGPRLMISIGSHQVAVDLMGKKGSTYNSRPRVLIAGEHATKGLHVALMPWGKTWERNRRLLSRFTTRAASTQYRLLLDIESKQVMHDLLSSNDFTPLFTRYGASVTNTLGYGTRLGQEDQEQFLKAEEFGHKLVEAMSKFHFALVELFPILDYLPRFLAPWKEFGDEYHSQSMAFYSGNLDNATKTPGWNWVKHAATILDDDEIPHNELSMLFGTALQAGVETIPSILRVFVKAMLLHPDCITKAQTELDRVVGNDRLPTFDDWTQLTYVNGIVHECLRWQSVMALGVPHATTQDDVYKGYHIPAGAYVFATAWAMGYDDDVFEDPYAFQPERWEKDPNLPISAFGYGRRVCPGKFLGIDSLYINISRALWGYAISHSYRDGKKLDVKLDDIDHAFTSSPRPFQAVFEVRSKKHAEVIEREWAASEKDPQAILEEIKLQVKT
ncbi:cytochrome P450 [Penicillium lividum]|nr:cytochrome P450 [Penicillium lividum]